MSESEREKRERKGCYSYSERRVKANNDKIRGFRRPEEEEERDFDC